MDWDLASWVGIALARRRFRLRDEGEYDAGSEILL